MTEREVLYDVDMRTLVRRLSHEIRNPLATMKSGLQLAVTRGAVDKVAEEYLRTASRQIDRIDRIIRRIQRFVSLDIGSFRVVRVAVLVDAVLQRILSPMSNGASQCPEVLVELSAPASQNAWCDPSLAETALAELLANALMAAPPQSAVVVSWRSSAPPGHVVIEVSDQGPGIPDEVVDRLNVPFFSGFSHGVGLGLNIAARAAQLNGGNIGWQNRPKGGARFTLTLLEHPPHEVSHR